MNTQFKPLSFGTVHRFWKCDHLSDFFSRSVMKARKSMKHSALVIEVVKQISARFEPKIVDIKKAIDALLEKEYIERVEGTRDTYAYVA